MPRAACSGEENAPGEWTAGVESGDDYCVTVSSTVKNFRFHCDCPYDLGLGNIRARFLFAVNEKHKNSDGSKPVNEDIKTIIGSEKEELAISLELAEKDRDIIEPISSHQINRMLSRTPARL